MNAVTRPQSPVVYVAMIGCIGLFALQELGQMRVPLLLNLALWPALAAPPGVVEPWPEFAPWQLISYALLHGGGLHLFFNMFGLWMFGRAVEWAIGPYRMAFYLLLCIFGAGLCQLAVTTMEGRMVPTVGISGGVMGLLPAFALLYPRAKVTLIFPPIPMPAPVFVVLYAVLELSLGLSGRNTGIAHFAHLGGMAFGGIVLATWYFGGELKARRPLG